jgi:fibronectin type 3 domain-containing protein
MWIRGTQQAMGDAFAVDGNSNYDLELDGSNRTDSASNFNKVYFGDLIDGGWNLLTLSVLDSTEMRIWLNGQTVSIKDDENTNFAPGITDLIFGSGRFGFGGTAGSFTGDIGSVRIYTGFWSDGDQASVYAEGGPLSHGGDATPPAPADALVASAGIGSVELDWADNGESDFASYTVYRGTSPGVYNATVASGLTTSNYTDGTVLDNTSYYYVLTATDDSGNESGYSNEASVTPGLVTDTPMSGLVVDGTASGSIADVATSDNNYLTLTEINNGTTSILEHVWVFNVTGAELATFYVEAHHSANSEGDDFVFAYSLDDVEYFDMLTVTKTEDDDAAQYFTLPSGTTGTVYVLAYDTDATPGNTQLDSLYIDELVIESETSSEAPTAAVGPSPADNAINVDVGADLSWTAGLFAASHDVYFGSSATPTFVGNQSSTTYDPGTLTEGTTYYWAINEVNASGTMAGPVWSFTTGTAGPKLSTATIAGVGDSWQVVSLPVSYSSPVIVATVVLSSAADAPAVARVRNTSGSSFELKVQNPSGISLSGYTVKIMAVEEGVYNTAEHGVDLEAIKTLSTGTGGKNNWNSADMAQLSPTNSYNNPVVLGQVMTDNDTDWSVFWASDGSRTNPATASSIYVGKHVGEDSLSSRANETLGVIILESGNGNIEGVAYTAGVGGDNVRGVGNGGPYSYPLSGLPTVSEAIVSAAAMDGSDGGWPCLFGPTPLSVGNLDIVFDEDQISDSERSHTSEQVAYIVFE